jgi:C4-dicarboxylate-specific signal transduction histidine kinase
LKAENEQLENQIGERKAVQNELQEDRDQLEQHLRQQSDELTAANEQLQHEISQREQAEERLALLQTRLDNINSIIQKHL